MSDTEPGESSMEATSEEISSSGALCSTDSLITDSSSGTASLAEPEVERPTSSDDPRRVREVATRDQPSTYSTPTQLRSLDSVATCGESAQLDHLADAIPGEADAWDLEAACAAGKDKDKEIDDWVSLDHLSPTVKVQVEMMLGEIPQDFRATLCRLHRKKLVSQLLVAIANCVWEDKCRLVPDSASTHIIAAGSTQIYKTTVPAAALLAGEPSKV